MTATALTAAADVPSRAGDDFAKLLLLDAMVPRDDAFADIVGCSSTPQAAGVRVHANGVRHHAVDATGLGDTGGAVSIPERSCPGQAARDGHHEPGAAQRLPRHARNLELLVPGCAARAKPDGKRPTTTSATTVDQIAAQQIGQDTRPVAVARDVDGPPRDRRPVR